MTVGPTGAGKSVIIKVLTNALTNRSLKWAETKANSEKETWQIQRLNTRAIPSNQIYG